MDTSTRKVQSFSVLTLILTLIAPLFAFTGNAQERATSNHRDSLCAIQFPINTSDFDPDYKSNQRALSTMRVYFDTVNISKIDSVIIVGSASPEGAKDFNTSLALKRAQSLKDIFVADGKIPENILKTATSTDTWSEVFDIMEEEPNFPNKDQTLTILKETPISDRMWMLKKFNYNEEYDYLVNVTFTRLRNAATILIYKSDSAGRAEVLSEILAEANKNSTQMFIEKPDSSKVTGTVIPSSGFIANDTIPVPGEENQKPVKDQKPLFALKTNLLYDAATIINISLEVPIGKHWSIAGELIFPWWLNEKKQNALQVCNGNLEVKYWFHPLENQKKGKFSTMTGWFTGVYGGAALYDIEYHGKGYQGESLFSTGLMGGYAHSIGKCLRMEYAIGLGYMQTHYRHYESKFSTADNRWFLYRKDSGDTRWIGPTQAKISLVWMLSTNIKKGEVR